MNPDITPIKETFEINASLLPERFTVIGALRREGTNDYIVIGTERGGLYCSWCYNPDCGFIWGHYRLTREEALKELVERG